MAVCRFRRDIYRVLRVPRFVVGVGEQSWTGHVAMLLIGRFWPNTACYLTNSSRKISNC